MRYSRQKYCTTRVKNLSKLIKVYELKPELRETRFEAYLRHFSMQPRRKSSKSVICYSLKEIEETIQSNGY
jgi:hypothetical protein